MDRTAIWSAIERNPELGRALLPYALDEATLYGPQDVSSTYTRFCEKLTLESPPYVLVCDRVHGHEHAEGIYDSEANLVIVPQTTFDAFQKTAPTGTYYVAHELGHAKYRESTRRDFLRGIAKAGAGGAALLAGHSSMRYLETKAENPHATEVDMRGTVPSVGVGAYAAFKAVQHLDELFRRVEELKVDDYARTLLGSRQLIIGIGRGLEQKMQKSERGAADIERLRGVFDSAIATATAHGMELTDEERQVSWYMTLSEHLGEKRGRSLLDTFIDPNYYPSFATRLKRQAERFDEPVTRMVRS